MKITKLSLLHFKRFGLGGIKKMVYTPEANVQLISGINGSGKSSLLSELTPLPANIKGDYLVGGSKEICITHRNKDYVLTTSTTHSFIVDGIELNTAGNKRVQLSLIFEHFKLTPSISKVIYGHKTMTTMSIADRKAWLALVSDVDLDYPLEVYSKLKKRYNDLRGAINILKARKVEVPTIEELNKKTRLADNIVQSIDILKGNIIPISESNISMGDITLKLKDIDKNIASIKSAIIKYGDADLEDMLNKKYELSNKISSLSADISKLESMSESKKLKSDLEDINNKLDKLDKYEEHDKLLSIIDIAITRLGDIDMDLVERVHTYDKVELVKEHDRLKNRIGLVTQSLNTTKAKLGLYSSVYEHDQVELDCPHCKMGFKLDKEDSKVITLNNKVKTLEAELDTFKEQLHPILSKLNEISNFKNMKDSYTRLISTFKEMDVLSKYMVDIEDSNGLSHSLTNLRHSVKEHRDLTHSKQTITAGLVSLSIIVVSKNSDNLVDELSKLTSELIKVNSNITSLKLRDNKKKELITLEVEQKKYMALKKTVEADMNSILSNDKIYTDIKGMKEELSILNSDIITMRTNLKLEDSRNEELLEYTERMSTIQDMMDKLSPTTGLIANTIMGDLGAIVADVNDIISNIWDYNIKVLPMSISSDVLTYKFPVLIGDDGDGSDDILLLSTSQREIIDLAFRMVSMVRLGLEDTTFILDEFARTFDIIHVNKAYDVVNELTNLFNQVFIVSHFESTYTKLEMKADISLLTKGYLGSDNNSDKIELEYY